MKKRNFKFLMILSAFIVSCQLSAVSHQLFAQDNDKLVSLSKKVIEVKSSEDAFPLLQELTGLYFKEHKYNECIDYLKSLVNRRKTLEPLLNYYIGFTRYSQLRYLEEAQAWDEYFNRGNSYRDEIAVSLEKGIEAIAPTDALGVYARLTLWKFHKDQNDALSDGVLSDLMNFVLSYAKEAKNPAAIKEVAAEFSAYGEKAKASSLYKIYVDKIVSSKMNDEEVNRAALSFYEDGNLDVAEGIYDVYIGRIKSSLAKEKVVVLLVEIARMFAYKDQGLSDALYAENVFRKVEETGVKDAFDERLIYLRAFNLEKAREFQAARDFYRDLVQRYPQGAHTDEAYFKLGIINTYILRDPKAGKGYFENLARKETLSPQVISSLYQLGLLSQWEGGLVQAKGYYNKLLEKAKDGFGGTVSLTRERLKEIDEARPIEYNLRTFLDASFKEEYVHLDMNKINLKPHPYRAKNKETVSVNSITHTPESGCLQLDLQYLWSGDLGQARPASSDSSFNAVYTQAGTKEINLVIVSPAGIIDRSIDLVDID